MKTRLLYLFITLLLSCDLYAQTDNENFDSFLFTFASNEKFQVERIVFPLEFITWDNPTEIGGDIVTKKISKEEWKHDYLFINDNYRPQVFDNFKGELRDTDERLFQWIGIETGVNVKYFFKRIKGQWFLIKKENLGD